jgi:hypothetical protein
MRKVLTMAVAALALAGCDKVTKTEAVGEPYVEQHSASCTYAGVCLTCTPGIGFDGKFSTTCAVKFSPVCLGSQTVESRVQLYRYTYESGKVRDYTQILKWLRDVTHCG